MASPKLTKMELNPECIGIFLQQALMCTEERERSTGQLFKFITISRMFLAVFRRYQCCHLVISKHEQSNTELDVLFSAINPFAVYPARSFQLSNGRVHRFIQWLNPKQMSVIFDGMNDQLIGQCQGFMRSTSAKLSLQIVGFAVEKEQKCFVLVLSEFAGRIRELRCNTALVTVDIVQNMELEKFAAIESKSSIDQADVLLRTLKTDKLSLNICDIRLNDSTLKVQDSHNYSIKDLELTFEDCSTEIVNRVLSTLSKCCPKLKRLDLSICFCEFVENELDPSDVVQTGLADYKLYSKLKRDFSRLDYLELIVEHVFKCTSDQYNDDWIEELKKRDEFKYVRTRTLNSDGWTCNLVHKLEKDDMFTGTYLVSVYYITPTVDTAIETVEPEVELDEE